MTRPRAGEPHVVGDVRDAEVDEDRVAVLEQDVARLEVAVDDAGRRGSRRAPRRGPGPGAAARHPPAGLVVDDVVERGAGHVAGHDVGALAHEVGVDDGSDPWRVHERQRVDLARQTCAGVVVVGDVRAQHLDGDGAAARVQGEVDDAHAALADLLDDDAVGTEPLDRPRRPGGRHRPRPCGRHGDGRGVIARIGPRSRIPPTVSRLPRIRASRSLLM